MALHPDILDEIMRMAVRGRADIAAAAAGGDDGASAAPVTFTGGGAVRFTGSNGFPWGPLYSFGLSMSGVTATIHAGLCFRGGVAIEVASTDLTITGDDQWAALEVTPGDEVDEDTAQVVLWTSAGIPCDHDGLLVRPLFKFDLLAAGAATLTDVAFGGRAIDVGMMGH